MNEINQFAVFAEENLIVVEEAELTAESYNNCCHIVQFKE